MEMLYYTVAGIGLYLAADWILVQLETRRGEAFTHRSIIFFIIILGLTLPTFALIRQLQP